MIDLTCLNMKTLHQNLEQVFFILKEVNFEEQTTLHFGVNSCSKRVIFMEKDIRRNFLQYLYRGILFTVIL